MSHDGLGTLEFSAILNGDDANQIEEILRGFVRQVRKERCQALSRTGSIHRSELVSDFESSSTESDSEVTKNERRKKKRKVEDWKLDAKAYNVPFVGTSVHKGDTGHVELGCWPTGFLQVYLDKSPLATELLGSDFQRLLSKAGSNRLQTVFVQSVTELITCAIPLEKIDIFEDTSNFDGLGRINEGPTSIASSRLRIVSLVMKDHVKKLFEILNEHASSGSNQRLIIAVLECLQNLVKTSVGTAREVVRGIDKFIKDTTLKQLATYNIFDKRETKMEDGKGDYDEVENTKESKRKRLTLKVRKSFLDLTSSLLESGDQSIIFYVTSPGGKDGALKTGMAYLGLRSALQQCKDMMILSEVVSKEAHDWSSAFNKFIKLIKSLICNGHGEHVSANNQGKVKREGTLSNKAKIDFLKGTVLDDILYIAYASHNVNVVHHPTFQKIQSLCDEIVKVLLCDVEHSPLLQDLHSVGSSHFVKNIVNRAIHKLLDTCKTYEKRFFVTSVFQKSPSLFTDWLRTVSIPDPEPTYSYLSKLSFLSFTLKMGPTMELLHDGELYEDDQKKDSERIIAAIIPRALTKNILTKGIQSANPLLVIETLKLLSVILRRCRILVESIPLHEKQLFVREKIANAKIPDLQVILGTRSKFEAYHHPNKDQYAWQQILVTMAICDVIKLYARECPQVFINLQFDWLKLLPVSTSSFHTVPVCFQYRILTTISSIHSCYENLSRQPTSLASTKSYNKLISILLETKNDTIFEVTRDLVRKVIYRIVNFARVNEGVCRESVAYEISLWIDRVNRKTAVILGELLDTVHSVTIQHFTVVNYIWKSLYPSEQVPPVTFSPLLSLALMELKSTKSRVPEEFCLLVQEISAKLLLVIPEQRLLACLVMYVNEKESGRVDLPLRHELYEYSVSILNRKMDRVKNMELTLAGKAFGKQNHNSFLSSLAVSITHSRKSVMVAAQKSFPFPDTTRSFIFYQSMKYMCQEHEDEIGKVSASCLAHVLFKLKSSKIAAETICDLNQSSQKCVYIWLFTTFSSVNLYPEKQSILFEEVIKQLEESTHLKQCENSDENLAMICASGIREYLSVKSLSAVTRILCCKCLNLPKECSMNRRIDIVLLLKIIESSSSYPSYLSHLSGKDVETFFNIWLSLLKLYDPKRKGTADVCLQLQLEKTLACILGSPEKYGRQAVTILKCICEYGIKDFFEVSRKDLLNSNYLSVIRRKLIPFGQGILHSLISYDVSVFAPIAMVLLVSDAEETEVSTPENELLVVIAHHALEYNELATDCKRIAVERVIIDRLCIIVKTMIQSKLFNEYSQLAFDVLGRLCNLGQLDGSAVEMFCEVISGAVESWRLPKQKEKFAKNVSIPFIRSLSSFFMKDPDNMNYMSLRRTTLAHFVPLLPRIFKFESLRTTLCSSILALIRTQLDIGDIGKVACLKEILLLCLKFGIDHVDEIHSPICLQICRTVLGKLYSTGSKTLEEDLFTVDKIHSMVMSHSNFDKVASIRCETRNEIIRLLVFCASRTDRRIILDEEKLSTLFGGFDANLSDDDTLLRRLILLYGNKDNFDLDPDFSMHNFVWGQDIANDRNPEEYDKDHFGTDHGQSWEKLIQKIDIKRIHRTIRDFPWWDSVEVPCSPDLEPSLSDTNQKRTAGDDCDSECESQSVSVTESEGIESDFIPQISGVNRKEKDLIRNQTKTQDDRYSPGFVLPLILVALDACGDLAESEDVDGDVRALENETGVRQQKRHSGEKQKSEDYLANPVKETFSRVAFRLCQKGVISLSIASLTSDCPKLRSTALAIIYRFLQALKTREAQNIGAWKSRSQIEMAINAIQRGLVLSRINMQQKQGEHGSQKFYPPRIPNICTLYLARSLLILTKPSDNMYPAVNKSFLRQKDYHGAFTNWYSIPMFMTLFCSVSDTVEQSTHERLWALNLLNDGMVDSLSFRLVSRRHIPELLLTTFDATISRCGAVQDDGECILLLKSIVTLVSRGGKASFNHFFQSVGMLAWIQSSMVNVSLNAQNHSPTILALFIQLIETVIRKAVYDFPEDFCASNIWTRIDAVNIGRGISDLYLKWCSTQKSDSAIGDSSIISSVSEVFWSVMKLNEMNNISFKSCNLSPHGMLLEACIRIIQQTTNIDRDYRIKALAAMCSLPIADQSDLDQATNFCIESLNILLLGNVQSASERQPINFATILDRISTLSMYFKEEDEFVTILDQLLGCRCILVTQHGLSSRWLDCVSSIVVNLGKHPDMKSTSLEYERLLNAFKSLTFQKFPR